MFWIVRVLVDGLCKLLIGLIKSKVVEVAMFSWIEYAYERRLCVWDEVGARDRVTMYDGGSRAYIRF